MPGVFDRRGFIVSAGAALLAPVRAHAQARRPALIAFQSRRDDVRARLFLSEMAALGHVEGRDFVVEFFDVAGIVADSEYARIVALAPAIIIPSSSGAAAAFARLTATVPIVTAGQTVESAIALVGPNFASPKGNVTGTVSAAEAPALKLLQLAAELVPAATAIGVISNSAREGEYREAARVAARDLDLRVVIVVATRDEGFATVFTQLLRERVGVIVSPTALFDHRIPELVAYSKGIGVPVLSARIENVEAGALFSYGPDQRVGYGRAAHFVDRLLKGAKPADLPVEQVSEFRLAVNLTAVRAWGFDLPAAILARADVVIE